MPDSAILKLVFSVTFLKNQGVPPNEAFAAGAAAALIPGALGLAVPLIVAGRERASVATISDRGTVAEVPHVIDLEQKAAEGIISGRNLHPVARSVFIEGGEVGDKGKVVDQKPKSGEFVPLLTDVKLTVSKGPPPLPPEDEDLLIDREIQKDVQAARAQITDATDKILKAIEGKEPPKYGGALEKKSP